MSVFPVENENHCDFVKLREMLIRVNMEDLREQTHARHYELYRRCKLEEMGFKDTDPDCKPFRYWLWSWQRRVRSPLPTLNHVEPHTVISVCFLPLQRTPLMSGEELHELICSEPKLLLQVTSRLQPISSN